MTTLIGLLPFTNLGRAQVSTSANGVADGTAGNSSATILPSSLDGNYTINAQFQVVFKKVTKKDPLSRRKALNEFMNLIEESTLDDIKPVLMLWPNFYTSLANDDDAPVRELTQISLQLLVSKCQKHIAPHLKKLVPVWLGSQYDDHSPAAKVATTCFDETFTNKAPNRARDVCLHCQHEIMSYLTRNLIKITPRILIKMNNITPLEADIAFERLTVCSLKSYNYFLNQMINCKINQINCKPFQLLNEPVYWNFSKSKSVYVR